MSEGMKRKIILCAISFSLMAFVFISLVRSEEKQEDKTKDSKLKEGKWALTMMIKIEGLPQEASAVMAMGTQGHFDMKDGNGEGVVSNPYGTIQMPISTGTNDLYRHGEGVETQWDVNKGITSSIIQCVTKNNAIPNRVMAEGCKRTQQRKNDTYNFQVFCEKENDHTDENGYVTYMEDSMVGIIKSHQIIQGRNMDSTIELSGKYLGPC
ncbi:MAG: DUF3617 family protein [Candidatus Omnitrophota bacterium]